MTGIIPPLPTPFNKSGELDLVALKELIAALLPDVDGFLLLGSNGEAVFLDEEERKTVLEAARAVIPADKIMLVGTGGESTRLVQDRNELAVQIGADYALVLPPHYYQGQMNHTALLRHYQTLAEQSALALLLYNMPAATTLSLSPELVAKLAKHDNIAGLKDSSGNIGNLTEIMRLKASDFTVMTGNAPTLLPALSLGISGGILAVANVAPKIYKNIIEHFQRGEIEQARSSLLKFNPLALAVTKQHGVPGLKAVLRLQGLPGGYPRAPLQDLAPEQKQDLQNLLTDLGIG